MRTVCRKYQDAYSLIYMIGFGAAVLLAGHGFSANTGAMFAGRMPIFWLLQILFFTAMRIRFGAGFCGDGQEISPAWNTFIAFLQRTVKFIVVVFYAAGLMLILFHLMGGIGGRVIAIRFAWFLASAANRKVLTRKIAEIISTKVCTRFEKTGIAAELS